MLLMMLIMFLPVFALALFLILPFWTALTIYIPILILGVVVNFKMMKSMKNPVRTGLDEMIGREALVIADIDPEGKVRIKNEIWAATGEGERFLTGKKVRIRGVHGLVLVVENPQNNAGNRKET